MKFQTQLINKKFPLPRKTQESSESDLRKLSTLRKDRIHFQTQTFCAIKIVKASRNSRAGLKVIVVLELNRRVSYY